MADSAITTATSVGGFLEAVAVAHPDWVPAALTSRIAASALWDVPLLGVEVDRASDIPFAVRLDPAFAGQIGLLNQSNTYLILKETMTMTNKTKYSIAIAVRVVGQDKDNIFKIDSGSSKETAQNTGKGGLNLTLEDELALGSPNEVAALAQSVFGAGDDIKQALDDLGHGLGDITCTLKQFDLIVPPKDQHGSRAPFAFDLSIIADLSSVSIAKGFDDKFQLKEATIALSRDLEDDTTGSDTSHAGQ